MKKVLAMILCLILIIGIIPGNSANASEENEVSLNNNGESQIQPRWTYISSTLTDIGIVDGSVVFSCEINCYSGTKKCAIIVHLQKKVNGEWSTVSTFTNSAKSTTCTLRDEEELTSRGDYRIRVRYCAFTVRKTYEG